MATPLQSIADLIFWFQGALQPLTDMEDRLHRSQMATLYTLRHECSARFGKLMRVAGMTSDTYKFQLRKLVKSGHVAKLGDGSYALTAQGKEFANKLDDNTRRIQDQPKLSMLIIARHPFDESMFLCQERLRNPYHGFFGCISGPVLAGEDIADAARRELTKQTGLTSTECTVRGFLRQRDYDDDEKGSLLEDKLFAVVHTKVSTEELPNNWPGGRNIWMTQKQLEGQEARFDSSLRALGMLEDGVGYDVLDSTQSVY